MVAVLFYFNTVDNGSDIRVCLLLASGQFADRQKPLDGLGYVGGIGLVLGDQFTTEDQRTKIAGGENGYAVFQKVEIHAARRVRYGKAGDVNDGPHLAGKRDFAVVTLEKIGS